MKTTTHIWGLWDCEELLSVHLTHDAARDAKDEHLESCRCFTDDQDAISVGVQIRAIRFSADPVPVENPVQGTGAGHDEQTAISAERAQPKPPRGGGRHADR